MPERKFRRLLVEQIDPQVGEKILEFGFGTGANILLVKEKCSDADLRGLDIDPKVQQIAHQKLAKRRQFIPLDLYDGGAFPHDDGRSDKVYSCLVLHQLNAATKLACLREIHRVLKKGEKIGHRRLGQSRKPADAAGVRIGAIARRFQNHERQRTRADARIHPRGWLSKCGDRGPNQYGDCTFPYFTAIKCLILSNGFSKNCLSKSAASERRQFFHNQKFQTMKNAVLILFALLLGFAACQNSHKNQTQDESKPGTTATPAAETAPAPTATAAPETVFACPMHPEVTGKSGDKCPKCKMNLEEKKTPETVYACPMHPEVTGKKGDKCPKCKMNLTEKK